MTDHGSTDSTGESSDEYTEPTDGARAPHTRAGADSGATGFADADTTGAPLGDAGGPPNDGADGTAKADTDDGNGDVDGPKEGADEGDDCDPDRTCDCTRTCASDRPGGPDLAVDSDNPCDPVLDVGELSGLLGDFATALFDAEGRVAAWNDGARRVTGYDDAVGSHYRRFFADEDRREGVPERMLERAREAGRAEDEGWRVRADGERILVREALVAVRADGAGRDGADDDGPVCCFGWLLHDRTEAHERERALREERAFVESVFAAQPDVLYAFDAEGNYLEWNDRVPAVTGYDERELADLGPLEFVAPEHRERVADGIWRVLREGEHVTVEADLLTKDGERIPYEFTGARMADDDGTVLGFTGVGRDVSDRKARERELERLERLNAVLRTVDETVVTADTREEIDRAVVTTFAEADPYRFAVCGRVDSGATGRPGWTPAEWAGIDESGAADVVGSYVDPPDDAPGESALETGEVTCFRNLEASPVEARRSDARRRGYGSVAVVPLVAGGRSFGVLVVAAAAADAFADRERDVIGELGSTLGHAIDAMTVRRLLYTDAVVELEFESTDRRDVLVDLSARAECRVSLDHVVPVTDDVFVYYVTITGADPDRFDDLAAVHPAIEGFRRIDSIDGAGHWELVVAGPTVAGLLAEYGARIESKDAENGGSATVVHASPEAPIRDLVESVTASYPRTTLQSKRTVEQPVETRADFRRAVGASLTEKQRVALETAYFSGYFEWPTRAVDAKTVADRLGIARQTFHQHLRVALGKLLEAYFEGAGEAGSEPP